MKKSNWKEIAELVGIAAIVASLIFVGLQLQQTQAIAIANQYQERAALSIDYRLAQIQSDTALRIEGSSLIEEASEAGLFSFSGAEIERYSPEEVGYFEAKTLLGLTSFDNNHFQYQSGFLTESAWRAYEEELAGMVQNDFSQWLWSKRKHTYREDFRNLVDRLILTKNSVQ